MLPNRYNVILHVPLGQLQVLRQFIENGSPSGMNAEMLECQLEIWNVGPNIHLEDLPPNQCSKQEQLLRHGQDMRRPRVVMLVFKASPATPINSFDSGTPAFPSSSSFCVTQLKHLSSEPSCVRTVWTNLYLKRLLDRRTAASPIRNKQIDTSIGRLLPAYQLRVVMSSGESNRHRRRPPYHRSPAATSPPPG